jgi:hypothetical protein
VQVSDRAGLANPAGSEACARFGNGARAALTGERAGRVGSPDMANLGVAARRTRGRHQRGRRPLAGPATAGAGLGRPCGGPCPAPQGPPGAPPGHDRAARTQGVGPCHRASDATAQRAPGAMQPNPVQAATAAVVAGRALATGNAGQHTRGRTQSRAALSGVLARGRQAARDSAIRVTARWHPVYSLDRRREAYHRLKRAAAPGGEWPAMGPLRRATRSPPAGGVRATGAGRLSGPTGRARLQSEG